LNGFNEAGSNTIRKDVSVRSRIPVVVSGEPVQGGSALERAPACLPSEFCHRRPSMLRAGANERPAAGDNTMWASDWEYGLPLAVATIVFHVAAFMLITRALVPEVA
jgi:hypothetical protein